MPTPEKFQTPEELGRQLYLERLKARKARAQEPKEGIVEKVKTRIAMKIITWIVTIIVEAVPITGLAPTWTLRAIYSHLKGDRKGLTLIMIILAACKDLFDAVSAQLASGLDWIIDLALGGLLIILDFQVGEGQ